MVTMMRLWIAALFTIVQQFTWNECENSSSKLKLDWMIYHIVHICSVSPQNGWSIVFSNQQDNCRDAVTSENTKQTWEEIQRTYLEKWSPKYFCHLLMMRPRIRHLTLSLWPCQKRKCKMENRTNPKLIPWQILACRNYEKSFTCCWDIKEEGCPVLQSTPPWSSSCSCWWWGSSWCSSSTSTLPSPPSTSSCGCAPFRF